MEGCDQLEGTGGDPLQPGRGWEGTPPAQEKGRDPLKLGRGPLLPGRGMEGVRFYQTRDLGPACLETDKPREVKTNMAMRPKTISLIGCIHGGVRSPYSG